MTRDQYTADLEAGRAAGVVLRHGDRGALVAALQAALAAAGYPLDIDGSFGPDTLGAVTTYQMAESMAVDGLAGPATFGHLLADVPDEEPVHPADIAAAAGKIAHVSARTLIAVAAADIGKRESPNGSNNGPAIAHLVVGYDAQPWMGHPERTDAAPWCQKACSVWIGIALGLGDSGVGMDWASHPFERWFGSVYGQLVPWARANGTWVDIEDDTPVPPGALVVMYRDGSGSDTRRGSAAAHVFVATLDHGDRVEGIDGNVSNRVKRTSRPKSVLQGYVAWWRVL